MHTSGNAAELAENSEWPLPELPGIRGWMRRKRMSFVGQEAGWYPPLNLTDRVVMALVRWQWLPLVGWPIQGILHGRGTLIEARDIGPGFRLVHSGFGVSIHGKTKIGRNVVIYHMATIGRGDPWRPWRSDYAGFVLEDDVIVCVGAVVANQSTRDVLTIGAGTIIGANSVLTQSTGRGEIWAGSPAKCVGRRDAWPSS